MICLAFRGVLTTIRQQSIPEAMKKGELVDCVIRALTVEKEKLQNVYLNLGALSKPDKERLKYP